LHWLFFLEDPVLVLFEDVIGWRLCPFGRFQVRFKSSLLSNPPSHFDLLSKSKFLYVEDVSLPPADRRLKNMPNNHVPMRE
jgi:hypothetical protein